MSNTYTSITVQELQDRGEAALKTGPFGTQLHASDYVSEGTPVINVRNIGFGKIRENGLEFITDETVHRLSGHLLEPGDIVFGRKGAVERHAFITKKYINWFQGSDCLRLRIKSPLLETKYLSYYFLTDAHKQWMINQCSHGATMASLNQAIISRISLRLPKREKQQEVISILSAYDDLIENNIRRIRILEDMAQSLYREWFVHFRFPGHEKVKLINSPLGKIPEGWEVARLGNLAYETRRSVSPDLIDPKTPYIGLEHLPRKSIALSEWGTANQVKSTKLAFTRGEILFGKIRPYFHKVGVAPIDGVCSSDIIVISTKDPQFYSIVLACVSSEEFVSHATQTSQGTKMPRANWKVLLDYPLLVPPDSIKSKFNTFMENVVSQIENKIFKNKNLRLTRNLLLPKLISGNIDISGAQS